MGAWIEIAAQKNNTNAMVVAPLVGAWIEIIVTLLVVMTWVSLPSWERGLK